MNWSIFLSTFGLVFVAELGDKTQLAIVAQTWKYRSPLPVFLGGSIALITVTALGAVGGQALGRLIPEMAIRVIAAALFVIMGGLVWRESSRTNKDRLLPRISRGIGKHLGRRCLCYSLRSWVTKPNWRCWA